MNVYGIIYAYLRWMMKKKKNFSPFLTIILSFLIVIWTGTILLLMPFATKSGLPGLTFIEAFFTSTSAVCVTGLTVVPDVGATLSLYGQIVLACLIEIGGLGFITITLFVFIILGMKIGIKNRFLMKEALNQDTPKGVVKMVKYTVLIAFTIQFIGAIFNFLILKFTMNGMYSTIDALGLGIFHTISSFNNAGFDLFGSTSLTAPVFADNILFNLNTAALIITGGIGFVVIFDIISTRNWKKFSFHTKIVLRTTFLLIISGTLLLWLLSFGEMNWLQAFFHSVSFRTAGFATVDIGNFKNSPAFILMIILMFIGASPCSTGGGIKTTTFFVLMRAIFSYATGRRIVTFHRAIDNKTVIKAFSLVVLAVVFTITITTIITILETGFGIIKNGTGNTQDIIFETFSAFATVGNSTGITSNLTWGSKLVLCLTMFCGRLGPLTIMNLWNRNWLVDNRSEVRYVEKSVVIG